MLKMTNQLVRFDTAALNRAFIGFDTLFSELEQRATKSNNYPPHNVVKYSDDQYEIQLAVTGFAKEDVTVGLDNQHLIVEGSQQGEDLEDAVYLHRGLAARDFKAVFPLAEHIEVGEVSIKHGMLRIALTRVIPEKLKPKMLEIKGE
jgi:molecular chaperone IbpA